MHVIPCGVKEERAFLKLGHWYELLASNALLSTNRITHFGGSLLILNLVVSVYVWRISFERSTLYPKCHVTFSKTKMNVDWHLHLLLKRHLNVTCLVMCVISISNVSIDVWFCFFTNHIACQILSRACQSTHIFFLFFFFFLLPGCKFLRVKCQKLAKKLYEKYTLPAAIKPTLNKPLQRNRMHMMLIPKSNPLKKAGIYLITI